MRELSTIQKRRKLTAILLSFPTFVGFFSNYNI